MENLCLYTSLYFCELLSEITMIRLQIVFISLLILFNNVFADTDSRVKRDAPRKGCDKAVGARDAKPGEFPFVASIHQEGKADRTQICGGAIIDKSYIITAARCAYKNRSKKKWTKMNESEIYVVAGDYDLKEQETWEQKIKVEKFIFPKEWDEKTQAGDVLILKLATPIEFKKKQVSAIEVTDDWKPKYLDQGHIVGWGTNKQNPEKKPDKLQVLDYVNVDSECVDKSANAYCAGRHGLLAGNGNMCDGDEGGPYICGLRGKKGDLCGIASRPKFPDQCIYTAVYTSLTAFDEWIDKTIKG